MIELNDIEKKLIKALNALGGKSYTRRIAEKANTAPQTASKYLLILKEKGLVTSDTHQPPHIYWELTKTKDVEEALKLIAM